MHTRAADAGRRQQALVLVRAGARPEHGGYMVVTKHAFGRTFTWRSHGSPEGRPLAAAKAEMEKALEVVRAQNALRGGRVAEHEPLSLLPKTPHGAPERSFAQIVVLSVSLLKYPAVHFRGDVHFDSAENAKFRKVKKVSAKIAIVPQRRRHPRQLKEVLQNNAVDISKNAARFLDGGVKLFSQK